MTVSPEALDAMMADPGPALTGLETGFAEHIGVPADQVAVTETDPDITGGQGFGRRLQGTELKVKYKVETKEGDDVGALSETLQKAAEEPAQMEALTASIQTSLADQGLEVEVTVMGVSDVEIVVLTPETSPAPTPNPGDDDPGDDDGVEASGGSAVYWLLIIAVVAIAVAFAANTIRKKGAEPGNQQPSNNVDVKVTSTPDDVGGGPAAAAEASAVEQLQEISIQIVDHESGMMEVPDEEVGVLTTEVELPAEAPVVAPAGPAIEGTHSWFSSMWPFSCEMAKNPCVAEDGLAAVGPGEQAI